MRTHTLPKAFERERERERERKRERLCYAFENVRVGPRFVCVFFSRRLVSGERDDALRGARRVAERAQTALLERTGASERELRASARAGALECTGEWAAVTRSETSKTVLERYLRPAAEESKDGCAATRQRAQFFLGEYVARLHADANRRVRSEEWRARASEVCLESGLLSISLSLSLGFGSRVCCVKSLS